MVWVSLPGVATGSIGRVGSRHDVGRAERDLLDLCEVSSGVAVEYEPIGYQCSSMSSCRAQKPHPGNFSPVGLNGTLPLRRQ